MTTPIDALRGVPNACQALPLLVTGGQPTAAQLEALAATGNRVVLDIRAPNEPRPMDEAALVRRLGMEYVNIPLITRGVLDDALMDRLLAEFRRVSAQPTFCHCAGGNRVGGALIPFLILDQGFDEEDAVSTAQRVGLSSRELLAWGLDYARRHRKA